MSRNARVSSKESAAAATARLLTRIGNSMHRTQSLKAAAIVRDIGESRTSTAEVRWTVEQILGEIRRFNASINYKPGPTAQLDQVLAYIRSEIGRCGSTTETQEAALQRDTKDVKKRRTLARRRCTRAKSRLESVRDDLSEEQTAREAADIESMHVALEVNRLRRELARLKGVKVQKRRRVRLVYQQVCALRSRFDRAKKHFKGLKSPDVEPPPDAHRTDSGAHPGSEEKGEAGEALGGSASAPPKVDSPPDVHRTDSGRAVGTEKNGEQAGEALGENSSVVPHVDSPPDAHRTNSGKTVGTDKNDEEAGKALGESASPVPAEGPREGSTRALEIRCLQALVRNRQRQSEEYWALCVAEHERLSRLEEEFRSMNES
eukprot:IDg23959t1